MPRLAVVPSDLAFVPFRGSAAVSSGLLTRDMLKGGTWRRLFPDVYVHATAFEPNDHRMWCDAAALMLKGGHAVDGLSAAFLWGVNVLPQRAPVSVSIERRTRMRPHPRLTVRRTVLLLGDVTSFAGIPVTTPLRTAFDLGRRQGRAGGPSSGATSTASTSYAAPAGWSCASPPTTSFGARAWSSPRWPPRSKNGVDARARETHRTRNHRATPAAGRTPATARPTRARVSPPPRHRSGTARTDRRNG